jgi:hypothetical protein
VIVSPQLDAQARSSGYLGAFGATMLGYPPLVDKHSNRRNMFRKSILRMVIILVLAATAGAQSTAGTITGTVSDITGAVLPGVDVTVTNEGTNLTRNLVTNESGLYTAPQLPIGIYRVEAQLPGFQTAVQSGIQLRIDQRARIDLALEIGQVSQIIEVTAEAPLIQSEDSSIGTVIDQQKVSELPLNGRNFESLVLLVPEAVTSHQGSHLGNRGGVVIAGMDEHYQSFYVDGVDNVDTIIRNFTYRPSIDAIEEFKVQSTGYAAEFGRNAGAVINVTTRSGTNVFHGSLFEYHRNKGLNGVGYFAAKAGREKEEFLRNQYGGTIGGPIVPNRTFFFFSYEGQRQAQDEIKRATVPTAAMRAGDLSELGESGRDVQAPRSVAPFAVDALSDIGGIQRGLGLVASLSWFQIGIRGVAEDTAIIDPARETVMVRSVVAGSDPPGRFLGVPDDRHLDEFPAGQARQVVPLFVSGPDGEADLHLE